MKYNNETGLFYFYGNEEDIAFKFMWVCLTDLSFLGKLEVIFRVIFGIPPDRFFNK
ncbi:MAG: hypothetical protein M0R03_12500 [Novosphingobium sp.]|nr:hypothetical protein [Novosphingobium sp.]